MSSKPLQPLFARNRPGAAETQARPLGVFTRLPHPQPPEHLPVALEPRHKDPLSEEER